MTLPPEEGSSRHIGDLDSNRHNGHKGDLNFNRHTGDLDFHKLNGHKGDLDFHGRKGDLDFHGRKGGLDSNSHNGHKEDLDFNRHKGNLDSHGHKGKGDLDSHGHKGKGDLDFHGHKGKGDLESYNLSMEEQTSKERMLVRCINPLSSHKPTTVKMCLPFQGRMTLLITARLKFPWLRSWSCIHSSNSHTSTECKPKTHQQEEAMA